MRACVRVQLAQKESSVQALEHRNEELKALRIKNDAMKEKLNEVAAVLASKKPAVGTHRGTRDVPWYTYIHVCVRSRCVFCCASCLVVWFGLALWLAFSFMFFPWSYCCGLLCFLTATGCMAEVTSLVVGSQCQC